MQRTTIDNTIQLSGIGLFSAQPISLTIAPSTDQSGIVFHHAHTTIPATIDFLSARPVHTAFAHIKPRCTSVGTDNCTIATIEHLLSALAGLGITDASISIDTPNAHCELPILDGSALDFVNAINQVGINALHSDIEPIKVTTPIIIEENDSSITIEPADSPSYTYTLDYPNQSIPSATVTWNGDPNDYANRIAQARTFCLKHEADALTNAGMFKHLSPKDMLVIGDTGPIDNTYRHPDECALHKLLDLIGDLALTNRPLCAKVTAIKSGHALAHQAARAIMDQADS
ncbi:MAG: UDP-3-O-[3-hydroxymyristoyl] N-acetylglucosamine deacetylase [Phycisphaerales bacterium]|nr:UDP-3-O-[3-hydroxymyristoyl] N-acetylglucosamine deacetylase [Phycisphaerales bacterium]